MAEEARAPRGKRNYVTVSYPFTEENYFALRDAAAAVKTSKSKALRGLLDLGLKLFTPVESPVGKISLTGTSSVWLSYNIRKDQQEKIEQLSIREPFTRGAMFNAILKLGLENRGRKHDPDPEEDVSDSPGQAGAVPDEADEADIDPGEAAANEVLPAEAEGAGSGREPVRPVLRDDADRDPGDGLPLEEETRID